MNQYMYQSHNTREKEREKGSEELWRSNGEKLPKFEKRNGNSNIRNSFPRRVNLQRPTAGNIIIKMLEVRDKERILKIAKKCNSSLLQWNFCKIIHGFLSRELAGEKALGNFIFKCWERKKKLCEQGILYLTKLSLKNKGEIKTFSDKQAKSSLSVGFV